MKRRKERKKREGQKKERRKRGKEKGRKEGRKDKVLTNDPLLITYKVNSGNSLSAAVTIAQGVYEENDDC